MTTAHWIREFVTKHPDYKYVEIFPFFFCMFNYLQFKKQNRGDSVVSERINYDLLTKMDSIQNGTIECPSLLDHPRTKTQSSIPETIRMAENCPSTC